MHECWPQHLSMLTAKNEMRHRNRGSRQAEKIERGKKLSWHEIKSQDLAIARAYLPSRWVLLETEDELPN